MSVVAVEEDNGLLSGGRVAMERERDLSSGGSGCGSKTFDVVVVLVAERERNVSGGGKRERRE